MNAFRMSTLAFAAICAATTVSAGTRAEQHAREQAKPAATSAVVFRDNFNRFDPLKWTVRNLDDRSPMPLYGIQAGQLVVEVDGGSDGYMGVASGAVFSPNVEPVTGDFELTVSLAELMRQARDGYKDNSGFGLHFGTATLWMTGNYSGYWPGYEYGTYDKHRISAWSVNSEFCGIDESFAHDGLYAVEMQIRRVGGKSRMGYRLNDGQWVSWSCALPDAAVPEVFFWSGDGGYTRSTGRFTGSMDKFVLRALGGE